MPQTSSTRREHEALSPREEDLRRQAEALHHLCRYHPGRLTIAELDVALSDGKGETLPVDTEVAIRELVCHGLAHRDGDFVIPSRAAIYYRELPESTRNHARSRASGAAVPPMKIEAVIDALAGTHSHRHSHEIDSGRPERPNP